MQAGLQECLAFHLTGKRRGEGLEAVENLDLRPAHFASYGDLTKLRYDYPLVLIRPGADGAFVQSLSGLLDAALKQIAGGADGDRVRKHALRLEQDIRTLAAEGVSGLLSDLWETATRRFSIHNDELFQDSLKRLRAAINVDGEVVDCDQTTAFRVCHHAWNAAHEQKARRFNTKLSRLISKLSDILAADSVHSPEGLTADKLKGSVGAVHHDSFDFAALSKLLAESAPKASLPQVRRERISGLLSVLKSQRFYAASSEGDVRGDAGEPYSFLFDRCADAIEAYRERLPKMVELAKAMAMAGLEIEGTYAESRHGAFFADFGVDSIDAQDLDLFPDYFIHLRAADMQPADNDVVLKVMSAGLRAKILVETSDLLESSPGDGSGLALGLRSRQLANSAIGLASFYVLQSSSSNLFRFRDRIRRGLAYPGPALFSVFVGGPKSAVPAYLTTAAAMESRAFPALAYDPSAGSNWASRFDIGDNPQPDVDWPVHGFAYEEDAHQRVTEDLPFTIIDFVACDQRYAGHFARIPRTKWNGSTAPVSDFLVQEPGDLSEKVPFLLMVDRSNALHRVIVDEKLVRQARHCAAMWRSLQELGGIHNSHAERLLAREREILAEKAKAEAKARAEVPAPAAAAQTPAQSQSAPAASAAAAVPEPAEAQRSPDEAYIETPRCTSCNECTQINDKMFGYDGNQQASIVNPDAGTYRQLVEAAENCQISIIHPGKPRNPNEPGLDELLKRAEPFL
jgi:hypothetical protein